LDLWTGTESRRRETLPGSAGCAQESGHGEKSEIVTVYYGRATKRTEAEEVVERIRESVPAWKWN
jgi:dihydroxyacetone kinase-like predicted kinase